MVTAGGITTLIHDPAAHSDPGAAHWRVTVGGRTVGSAARRDGALALLRAIDGTDTVALDVRGTGTSLFRLSGRDRPVRGAAVPARRPVPGTRNLTGPVMSATDHRPVETIPPEALLAGYPEPMAAIAQELRSIVRAALPDAIERVRSGWRLIGYDVPVGRRMVFTIWIGVETKHVHLGFERGVLMADPGRVLEGEGITKLVRWLTFVPGDPLDQAALTELLHECARIARMSRGERALLEAERRS